MLGLVPSKLYKKDFECLNGKIEMLLSKVSRLDGLLKKKLDADAVVECEDCGRLILAVNGLDRGAEAIRDGAGGYFIRDLYACEGCEEIRARAQELAAKVVDSALISTTLGLDDEAPEETQYDAKGNGCGGCATDTVMPCGAQKADVDDGK